MVHETPAARVLQKREEQCGAIESRIVYTKLFLLEYGFVKLVMLSVAPSVIDTKQKNIGIICE